MYSIETLDGPTLALRLRYLDDQQDAATRRNDTTGWKAITLGMLDCLEELDRRTGYVDRAHTGRLAEFREQVESGNYFGVAF